jgi:hypothetical protein
VAEEDEHALVSDLLAEVGGGAAAVHHGHGSKRGS